MTDPGLPLTTGEGNTAEMTGRIEWYVQCLRDVRAGKSVRGMDEARAGYEAALAECGRLRERKQAAHGEGYDQAVEDVWSAPVCSVCGADHDADESAMCEGGEVVSFREWVEVCGRLREQLDAARQALDALATSLEQKVAGNKQGPDMGWTHPDEPADQLRREVGYVIEDARAALKERDE